MSPTGYDESFRRFVVERADALLRTAYLMCADRARAEDLLQTALWDAYRAWPRIRDQQRLEHYVRRCLLNAWLGWSRRASNRERAANLVSQPVPDHSDGVAQRDPVLRALALLPPRQRATVVLRFYADMTERQVARAMRCSVGTVKHQAADALAQLRRDPALRAATLPLEVPATASLEKESR